ncbi:MAG TPA: hypothetical protein VIH71_11995 [Solirubrobacteraceae bacterium]
MAVGGLLPALKAKRAQKKAQRKEMKEKLGKWSFFTSYDPGAPIHMIVEGDHIGATSGDGEAIGLMIVRICRLFGTLGSKPQLETMSFAKSVTLAFRAPETEAARAQAKLEDARRLDAAAGGSPSPEQAEEIGGALRGALTDLVVAAEFASELVAVPSTEAPEVAVGLGSNVAGAYKTLANAVAQTGVTLTIEAPAHEPTELTPAKAIRVAEELNASTEPRETTITAFGTLSIANQELHGFGLRLDSNATRDPLLKGRRVVNGTYLPEVEAKIRDENLWGSEVRASLLVVRDALISTSTVRPPTFTLLDVEPRYGDE